MIAKEQDELIEMSWNKAWESNAFRIKLLSGSILFISILLFFPYFFAFVQKRNGLALNDWLLEYLPSVDASVYIFSIIYITVVLCIIKTARSPQHFLLFLWSCVLLNLARIITITLIPLEPPVGIVPLIDPILRPFYRDTFITRDLFFSGHTSSLFLVFLILQKKWEKILALIATILIAILLLLQHIHYFIDVVAAPVFVYLIYILAKRICAFTTDDTGLNYRTLQNEHLNP